MESTRCLTSCSTEKMNIRLGNLIMIINARKSKPDQLSRQFSIIRISSPHDLYMFSSSLVVHHSTDQLK